MTDRDPRDPWPPLPRAEALYITPDQLDLSRPYRFRGEVTVLGQLNVGQNDPGQATTTVLFVRAPSNHVNLVEVDGTLTDVGVLDVESGVMRLGFQDLALSTYTQAIGINQDGTVEFPNGARGIEAYSDSDTAAGASGFTNTAFQNLDALDTTALGSSVSVSLTTGTEALVLIGAQLKANSAGPIAIMSFAITGAYSLASSDTNSIVNGNTGHITATNVFRVTGMTAGSNAFTLQARSSTGAACELSLARLTVIPL